MKDDIKNFAERNVNTIICLLDEYELRTIGVSLKNYLIYCKESKIDFIHFPIVEMGIPKCSFDDFD